jgi:hypothetical protein
VNQAVVDADNQLLFMRISPLPKECLVERLKNVSGLICAFDFGTGQESIDDMEPIWVLHEYKHELLL